jgi:DNA-binding protein H-NS
MAVKRRAIKEHESISPFREAREGAEKSAASEEKKTAPLKAATGKYLELFRKYLAEAEELYRKGDLPQSGEKYWGATAALLNAIAEERGWPHYSHRDYAEIVEKLSEQLKEPLGPLFANAERLHANYHHSFLSPLNFKAHREQTLKLVEKLVALLRQEQEAQQ